MTEEAKHDEVAKETAKEAAPAKRYRLLTRAQMHGAIREPGYVFTLGKDKDGNDELGPHRTVVASNHGAQITDHMNSEQELVNEPLYEEVKEEPVIEKPTVEISAAHEQDKGRIADLERQLADKDKQLGEAHWRLAEVEAALKVAARAPDEKPGAPLLLEAPESNLPAKS